MKKTKRVMIKLVIVSGLLFCIAGMFSKKALADMDFGFQPRVAIGWMDYKFDFNPSRSAAGSSLRFNDSLPVLGIGSTFFLNRFYLDLYFQHTAKGSSGIHTGTYVKAGTFALPVDADATFIGDAEFYHWNFSATIGYQLMDTFTLYAGYKHNETSFDTKYLASFHMVDNGSPVIRYFQTNIDFDYEGKGPFLGGTYGFIVGDKGVLSLNLAVALMDGDLTQSGFPVETRTGLVDSSFNLSSSGDSIGLSYGVGWRSNLTDRIGFSLSFSGYNYDYDADDESKSDFEETVFLYSVGLSYAF